MNLKTERFEMRLDPAILGRVDAWRGKQDDLPSRAEAIRRLIEVALASMSDTTINMNASEKLIVSLLCELHKNAQTKGELDPDFIQSAVSNGHYWALKWKYQGLFHGYHDDDKTLSEVVDILDMWSFVEEAIGKLSPKDKDYIKAETKRPADDIKFVGFDGNNEHEHLNIAHFLINEMDRFTEFKDRGGNKGDLNCHYPSLDIHRRMLDVFMSIRKKLVGRSLNAQEIVEILNARIHPENR